MKKVLVCISLLVLFACKESSQSWPPESADIHPGEDACAACRMIISEERYGAQLHERGKQVQLFDDYGCLLKSGSIDPSRKQMIYVRSFEDGKWIPEDRALFIVSKKISSPMGYGIVAFLSKESAAKFAKGFDDSQIFSSSELMATAGTILPASHKRSNK